MFSITFSLNQKGISLILILWPFDMHVRLSIFISLHDGWCIINSITFVVNLNVFVSIN